MFKVAITTFKNVRERYSYVLLVDFEQLRTQWDCYFSIGYSMFSKNLSQSLLSILSSFRFSLESYLSLGKYVGGLHLHVSR